jgi:hypothetical protein
MPNEIDQALREQIKEIAREVFKEMIESLRPQATVAEDLPPEPKSVKGKPGRRQNRDYEKISVTLDSALWEKFKAERDRLKVSNSRLIDIILWQRYGKPRLSFESKPNNKPKTTIEISDIDTA